MDKEFGLVFLFICLLLLSSCKSKESAPFGSLGVEDETVILSYDCTPERTKATGVDFRIVEEDYSQVREAINRGVNYLISRQAAEGYWMGSLENRYFLYSLLHYDDALFRYGR